MSRRRRQCNMEDNFSSIAHGSLELLREYLQHGGMANLKNSQGFSLLHAAVQDNLMEKVKLLIQHNCDVDAADVRGCTSVHVALLNKHNAVLEILLEAKANVNTVMTVSFIKVTPLLHALLDNNVSAVKLILTKGHNCDVNMDSQFLKNECTALPLAEAIMMKSEEMCELLLKNGASVTRLTNHAQWHEAASYMCQDLTLVKLLLKYSNEPDLPFHFKSALDHGKLEAAEIILTQFNNPFQFYGLGYLLSLNSDSVSERLVKFVVKPYSLATMCSMENKILYRFLDCIHADAHMKSLVRRVKTLRGLKKHGLVIHSQTIHRFCRNRDKDSACQKCLATASQISDMGDVTSLKGQCCSVVRQNLHTNCRGMFDFEMVQTLPLPGPLIDFICMKDW